MSDEEWAFVAPYLTLLPEDVSQRKYDLREVFNGVRYIVKTGAHWRLMPHDLPPWPVVYQQMRRWMAAGCFESDRARPARAVAPRRGAHRRRPRRRSCDSRTLQSTPESGARAGYDGHKRRKGSKVHAAVDTLGHLLALLVTPANEQDRAQVEELAEARPSGRPASTSSWRMSTRATPGAAGRGKRPAHGIELAVVKLPEAKRGFVLLPRRWVVERDFAWAARFRRLARDYERLAATLAACTSWPSPASCSIGSLG